MKPAIVKYIGDESDRFIKGKCYEAFFLEYWEGDRDSLHVRGEDGEITDFNLFSDFEVISDEDNLLNDHEATVRCLTHDYDDLVSGLTYGKEYKAIGRDKDGLYLVMDDSYCCYFYSPDIFEVVEDEHGILERRSVYYSFHGGRDDLDTWRK